MANVILLRITLWGVKFLHFILPFLIFSIKAALLLIVTFLLLCLFIIIF